MPGEWETHLLYIVHVSVHSISIYRAHKRSSLIFPLCRREMVSREPWPLYRKGSGLLMGREWVVLTRTNNSQHVLCQRILSLTYHFTWTFCVTLSHISAWISYEVTHLENVFEVKLHPLWWESALHVGRVQAIGEVGGWGLGILSLW